jgi:hypothetical protein
MKAIALGSHVHKSCAFERYVNSWYGHASRALENHSHEGHAFESYICESYCGRDKVMPNGWSRSCEKNSKGEMTGLRHVL